MKTPRRMAGAASVLALILSTLAILALPAAADHGNNGTVKVDEQALDGGPGENGPGAFNSNDPHIDCTGRIEWYGFDEGQQDAEILFEVWNPTLQTGAEGAQTSKSYTWADIHGDGPGGTELDGFMSFDLSDLLDDYQAHPQQGFHVKVTVHTTASQGADVKHKVFWIGPCEGNGGPGEDTGSLTVAKTVEGNDVPAAGTTFLFTVSCSTSAGVFDLAPSDASTTDRHLTLTAGATSSPLTGIPTGAECDVVETEDRDADSRAWTVNGAAAGTSDRVDDVVIGDGTTVAVAVKNVFNDIVIPPGSTTGSISIAKALTGNDAPAAGTLFTFSLACTSGGQAVDLNGGDSGTTATFSLTAGQAARVFAGIATGATCTVTETDDDDADSTAWTVNGTEVEDDASSLSGLTIGNATTVAVVAVNEFTAAVGGVVVPRPPVVTPPVVTPPTRGPGVTPLVQPGARVLGVQQTRNLPRTGAESAPLAGLGLSLMMVGAALTLVSRRDAHA